MAAHSRNPRSEEEPSPDEGWMSSFDLGNHAEENSVKRDVAELLSRQVNYTSSIRRGRLQIHVIGAATREHLPPKTSRRAGYPVLILLGSRLSREYRPVTPADRGAAPALLYADWVQPISGSYQTVPVCRRRNFARPSFTRAVEETRPYRRFSPPVAPDHD